MLHSVRLVAALCLALALPGLASAQDYRTWYLAEGSTALFEQEILIGNPNNAVANVQVQYLLPTGPGKLVNYTVEKFGRKTIRAHQDEVAFSVSAVITSDVPIVVERSMYWGGATRRLGGHNTTGVLEPKAEWFLAEGITNPIFDQYLLIQNPNAFDVTVEVALLGDDGIRDTLEKTIGANSRGTIAFRWDVGGKFLNRAFSTKVTSKTPGGNIIVERAIYWGGIFAGGLNPGGTNAAGISQLSDTWRFAEGFAEGGKVGGFLTFLLLANPTTTDTTVDVTFFLEDGAPEVVSKPLPANSRGTVWVNYDTSRAKDKPFSIVAKSRGGVQIAAERVMYWGRDLREGHVVSGVPAAATQWAFADGQEDRFNGIDYDTYYLVSNANDAAATITATFLFEDGRGVQKTVNVGANSRGTINTGTFPELSNRRFAAFFSSNQPVVMERAVYWGTGYYGGHASAGVPWPNALDFTGLQGPQAATVTSASPNVGTTNGGTDVTIKGTGFVKSSTVRFGGVPAAGLLVADAETIIARTPGSTARTVDITVTTLGNTATLANAFTYEAPPPPPPPPPPPTSGTQARGPSVAEFCTIPDPKAGAPATAIYRSMCSGPTRTGTLPLNFFGLVNQLAIERRDFLIGSCVKRGGNINFIVELVRRLRETTGTNRWGLNYKRGGEGISDDIVTYFYGPEGEEMEGDLRVYIIDVIGNHCPDAGNPGPNWQDQTNATRSGGTVGRWTTAGRF